MRKKLVFMGTPAFSVKALEVLANKHDILCVYTQPPRPAKRGKKLQKTAIHERSETLGLPVRTPTSLKEEITFLKSLNLDAIIVAAYGLLLPKNVLDLPKKGCLNIHASLLPRWRGAAPIERAIMAGDSETGITIMQMDSGLDTGDMLAIKKLPIHENTTAQTLHDALSELGAEMMANILDEEFNPISQPENGVTYAHKLKKEEGLIDWSKPAIVLDRQIRSIRSYFEYNGERIRVIESVLFDNLDNKTMEIGKLIDDNKRLIIACGEGTLRITTLQRAGKKPVKAEDFLRGYSLEL